MLPISNKKIKLLTSSVSKVMMIVIAFINLDIEISKFITSILFFATSLMNLLN
ncbi:hypothetical protein BTN49_0208 [Candidatus Enterovibrio escicola]|uniref:Uncharacterized protein n=1 Tax=Candidatus Enterovibrio escicola TaxID=1927127 RepID=A0A2A5T7F1_9GAMM|nr:hypothetical protein BTN49_0208 [Candidatus Enterovibrio escacola]